MTLKFSIYEFGGHPEAYFDEEPEPRRSLLGNFLHDLNREEPLYLGHIARAEAGEPNVTEGNHAVWAIMNRNKVVLEEMLYGEERDTKEPARTEITLTEAKQLILDWLEAKKRWLADRTKDAAMGSPSSLSPTRV